MDVFQPTEPRGNAWEHPMGRQKAIPMTQAFVDGYFRAKTELAKGNTQNPFPHDSESWAGFEEGLIDFAQKTPVKE